RVSAISGAPGQGVCLTRWTTNQDPVVIVFQGFSDTLPNNGGILPILPKLRMPCLFASTSRLIGIFFKQLVVADLPSQKPVIFVRSATCRKLSEKLSEQ